MTTYTTDLDATDIRPDSRTMIWPRVGTHDGLEVVQYTWDGDAAHVDVTMTPSEMRTVAAWLVQMAEERGMSTFTGEGIYDDLPEDELEPFELGGCVARREQR